MNTEILLRPAVEDDAAALTELAVRSKGHWGHDPEFLERARPELAVSSQDIAATRVVVAERDGEPVGFSALRVHGVHEPVLDALFVDPSAIGTGLGKRLLRDVIDFARQEGLRTFVLQSDPDAEAFYRSQGAVRIGEVLSSSTGRALPLLRFTL